MKNDRRIVNMLIIIASKVFEFEIDQSSHDKLSYSFEDIIENREESAFVKLHR